MSMARIKLDRLFPGKGRLCCAFFLPAALFLLLCACIGVVPFGPENLFIQDMHNQYSDYLSYLGTILGGENNFIYTFSKALGGDMIGFSAYYLLSPFNILFVLFDNADYSLCLTLAVALKLGTAGLTAAIFFDALGRRSYRTLIFSTAYALCGYCLIYASNIMWLDGVLALPLVALGIRKLLEEKKSLLYVLALAYSLITNYYIGYMLCIFSVLYFALCLFGRTWTEKKAAVRALGRFALASLGAGALSAFVLLPTFLSLEGTKAGFSPELFTLTTNFSLTDFADRFFAGSIDYEDLQYGLPNVFCGTVTLLGLFLFFLNRGIPRRERILSAALLAVFFLSLWVNAFNLVWHGFNPPVWFPYRYSFVVSFFALSCACRALERPEDIRGGRWAIPVFGLLWAALLGLAACGGETMDIGWLTANVLFMIGALGGLVLLGREKSRRAAYVLLVAVQFASLFAEGLGMERLLLHTASSYADYEAMEMNDTRHHTAADYESFIVETEALVEYIREQDAGFYRTEKTYSRTANDALQFAYYGLSHFSSTHKTSTKSLLRELGYYATGYGDYYGKGSTMAMDSFLGVKYLLSEERDCLRPYTPVAASEAVAVFCNPYALPLCYGVSAACLETELTAETVFERQNEMFSLAAGVEAVYAPVSGLALSGENITTIENDSMLRLERQDPAAEGVLHISFTAESEDLIYASFYSPVVRQAELWLNGELLGETVRYFQGDVFCLGSFSAGERVELSIYLQDDSMTISQWSLVTESEQELEEMYSVLAPAADESLERLSSSRLRWEGTLEPGQGALLLTVPYEANWKAWVDGEDVETVSVLGGFVAVPVGEGTHSVELRYVPRGLAAGCAVSAVALVLLAFWILQSKKQREKERERAHDGTN